MKSDPDLCSSLPIEKAAKFSLENLQCSGTWCWERKSSISFDFPSAFLTAGLKEMVDGPIVSVKLEASHAECWLSYVTLKVFGSVGRGSNVVTGPRSLAEL